MELVKYMLLINRDGYLKDKYFPLQFCSLFLYVFPIISLNEGKLSEFLKPFAYAGGMLASLLALSIPINIIGHLDIGWLDPRNRLYTLSFLYHGWILFCSLYMVLSGFYVPKKNDLWRALLIVTVTAFIAQLINSHLGTDFMLLNKATGNPLGFIIKDFGYWYYIIVQFILMLVGIKLLLISGRKRG
jgi:uncharacterized membrane protein YwaF